jgi:hypothetical protein
LRASEIDNRLSRLENLSSSSVGAARQRRRLPARQESQGKRTKLALIPQSTHSYHKSIPVLYATLQLQSNCWFGQMLGSYISHFLSLLLLQNAIYNHFLSHFLQILVSWQPRQSVPGPLGICPILPYVCILREFSTYSFSRQTSLYFDSVITAWKPWELPRHSGIASLMPTP